MNFVVISGSHRKDAQSLKVANYMAQKIESLLQAKAEVISLSENPLPLWDESVYAGGKIWQEKWQPMAEKLKAADGFVVITPEWAGMVPPGLKNFFLLASASEVGHKPAMITSVSAGISGAYPIAELHISSTKNNKMLYTPEHIIVRNVNDVLNGEKASDDRDQQLRDRIDFALKVLQGYAGALKPLRESGIVFDERYPYGM